VLPNIELFKEVETERRQQDARPRLLSLRGVDTATLTLTDVDLGACLFAGAHHLDQLRIEGPRPFPDSPPGWHRGRVGGYGLPVWRWTRRQTLAEEHQWRAGLPLSLAKWTAGPERRVGGGAPLHERRIVSQDSHTGPQGLGGDGTCSYLAGTLLAATTEE
jgi:hypothetical protein